VSVPSAAYVEGMRIQRAALRALRSGMRSRLTDIELARLAECSQQAAGAALRVLQHDKRLEADNGKRPAYRLTERGRVGAEP
jgi:hypothetical protein